MKERVKEYILREKLIGAGDRVLLGCSGGADSMCLLYLLAGLRKELKDEEAAFGGKPESGFELFAVHVHHHIRGTEADEDAAFVEEVCKKLDVPCTVLHRDVPKRKEEEKLSLEEAARISRYEAFEEAAAKLKANKLALAHHMEDRAETMLFQMIRGSGLRGSAGMQPKRDIGTLTVVRPLLTVSREEIRAFNTENGISWREDSTNTEDDLTRNRIRHEVLPALGDIRRDAVEKLNELGMYFTEVDDYLRREATAWISVYMRHTDGEIPEDPFKDTPKILREYIVAELLRLHGVPMKDKGRVHIDAVAELIHAQVGKRIEIVKPFSAVRTYKGIAFRKIKSGDDAGKNDPDGVGESSPEEAGKKLSGISPECPELRLETRVFPYEKGIQIPQKEYTKWFDYDKIKGSLELRTRKAKDVFSQAAGAHKKLKDFFIDEKIPQEMRDAVPLVADGNNILWAVGVRMSEEYKVTKETKNIIEITIRREEE